MSEAGFDIKELDKIIKNTVRVINQSRTEIFEIAENAKRECSRLEKDLEELKLKVKQTIENVERMEKSLKENKKRLMVVSRDHQKYTEAEIKKAYEDADNVRIELAVNREREQIYIQQRNFMEIRIKEAYRAVEKAENLINNVGAALGYLTGDLANVTDKLADIQSKKMFGIRIIKAQEDERRRVARDIHDGPAQSMSNVVMKAEICEKLIDVDIEKAREELKTLKAIVRNSLKDVRKIIYDLRPMSLDDLGLVVTLQKYIDVFQTETGIMGNLRKNINETDLNQTVSVTVFRVVQEALNNVKKYSQAKNVNINIDIVQGKFMLFINDDGKGFDTKKIFAPSEKINSGFGLMSMKERVELLKGEFGIMSHQGKGTWIRIAIPLTKEEEV